MLQISALFSKKKENPHEKLIDNIFSKMPSQLFGTNSSVMKYILHGTRRGKRKDIKTSYIDDGGTF